MHIGIDYGSKMAGTTAIAFLKDGLIHLRQSEKKQDADKFILDQAEALKPTSIFIDAPLSLPDAFYDKGENFFYRQCDVELKAMSPMFLGGLTARAISLKRKLEKQGMEVFECYPKALVHSMGKLKALYLKKNLSSLDDFLIALTEVLPQPFSTCTNWHQADALLAWYSGFRFHSSMAEIIGKKSEGQIIY